MYFILKWLNSYASPQQGALPWVTELNFSCISII